MRAILALLLMTGAALAADPEVPVPVGGMPDMDACMSQGEVRGLNPDGDNFLAVRSGPDGSYDKIDELYEGDLVNMCSYDGDWIGVVYGGDDCEVGSPIDPAEDYAGPCSSGWVYQDYIELTAG